MKIPKILSSSLALLLASASSDAAVTLFAEYHLGEAGSLAGTGNLPQDSSGNGLHYTGEVGGGSASVFTAGVTAPGSTAFLSTADGSNQGWFADIYGGPLAQTPLQTDNFGFGIYVQAAANSAATRADVFLLGEDNGAFGFSLDINGWAAGANGVAYIGPVEGTGFTANTWVHLALIRSNGVATFYLDGVAQSNTYSGVPVHGEGHLSVEPNGTAFFDGFLDEARVVTFSEGTSNGEVLNALMVPEPSTAFMAVLSGAAMMGLRRRRA